MKPRFSLFSKVLIWFFLNLTVLGVVLLLYTNLRLHVPPDSPLSLGSGGRFRTQADLIARELSERSIEQWTGVLERYSAVYQVDFMALSVEGRVLAGPEITVPEEVIRRLPEIARPIPFPPPHGPAGPHAVPPRGPRPPFPPPGPDTSEVSRETPPPDRPHFSLKTTDPTRYWYGINVPVRVGIGLPPRPVIITAASGSITGNGLFFDPWPFLAVTALIVVISVILWLPMIQNITRPIARMTRAAEQIAQGRFHIKLNERRLDEIGQLGKAINDMAARLAGYVKGQKRFLGDVAHELASPIARIQLGLGILERKIKPEYQDNLRDVREEVEHMSNLVNELLSFTRAEVNPAKVKLRPVRLAPLVERVVHREARASDIRVRLENGTTVTADPELLARALANVIRNAVRYAGEAGPVEIKSYREGKEVRIEVRDFGPGVPEESLPQLFEPFYRPQSDRQRETGGVGLGLSIVKTCIETCQGSVTGRNMPPTGFAVTFRLKAADRSRGPGAKQASGLK